VVKLLGGSLVILIILLGIIFKLYDHEKEERIKAIAAFNQAEATRKAQLADFKAQSIKLNVLNVKMAENRIQADIINNQLNGYRSREKLLQKKPKSIERLANAATKRVFNNILRATSSRDGKDKATAASADTDN